MLRKKTRKPIAAFICLTAMMVVGCDGIDVLTDATAVQLETSLISMMNTAVSYVFYSLFDLPLTNVFS
jgi:hypothetical protein